MKPFKIFKVGSHTSMQGVTLNYSKDQLADCVTAYSPQTHEAPLVLGHPKTDDPAMGWVDHLELSADGYLLAYPKQLDPDFAEGVNTGKHNKVSASFYLPDSPAKTSREIELEQQLASAQATLKAQKNAEQKSVASDFAESLVEAGQLPPRVKDKAIALLVASHATDQVVNFSEGEVSITDGLKSLLSDLPKIVEFGEHNSKGRVDPSIHHPENPSYTSLL